jgi:hypothetical protein
MDAGDGRIFVSYRREDSAHVAGRLVDRLIERFGVGKVFMDVDSLEPGVDFAESIERAVEACNVLLAVIGENWADVKDEQGRRRLEDPSDFVVLEIRAALERDVRVIPVLVDDARMPRPDQLPPALERLTRRHAVRVHHESFRRDIDGLINVMGQTISRPVQQAKQADGWPGNSGGVIEGSQRGRLGGDSGTTPQMEAAVADLTAAVRRTWSREAVHRGLTSPLPMAVQLRSADPRIAAHPAQWADHFPQAHMSGQALEDEALLTGTATDMATLYGRVTTGRLVIVGEPGAGKTGAAVLLLLALCDSPRTDGRIPVWFPMASWDPTVSTVGRWMASQLTAIYGTPAIVARKLVEDARLLPVFDGLDEIPERIRPAAMAGLRAIGVTPLIVTCRTAEYTQAVVEQILPSAAVVEVVPVDPATAASYLVRSGSADFERWQPVVAALRAASPNPCREALSSPLMLGLARTVYQAPSTDPTELLRYSTASDVENRLLDGLVPAVYGRDALDLAPEQARRFLSFFANNLHLLGPGAVAWWRLPLCVPGRQWRLAMALVYALLAFLFAIIFGLAWVPYWTTLASVAVAFAVALTVGLAVVSRSSATRPAVIRPSQWRRPGPRDLTRGFKTGLLPGLVVGIVVGLVVGVASGLLDGLRYRHEDGLLNGLMAGLMEAADIALGATLISGIVAVVALSLTAAFSRQQRDAVTPLSAFRTDIRAGPLAGLVTGLIVGFGVVLAGLLFEVVLSALDYQDASDVPISGDGLELSTGEIVRQIIINITLPPILVGFFAGLVCALWFALRRSAVYWYALAVELLARRGVIPRRPLKFLEDAYQRGVMRQAGMVYEFRHARLADRLAASNSPAHIIDTAQHGRPHTGDQGEAEP